MVGTVVAATSIAAIAIGAVMAALWAIIVDAVMPDVMAQLMLAVLMVHGIVAAASCLGDGGYREGAGDGERGQGLCVTGLHVGVPPRGVAV